MSARAAGGSEMAALARTCAAAAEVVLGAPGAEGRTSVTFQEVLERTRRTSYVVPVVAGAPHWWVTTRTLAWLARIPPYCAKITSASGSPPRLWMCRAATAFA